MSIDWTYIASISTLPYRFSYGAAVIYNNEPHIIGGVNNSDKHYKFDGSTWVEVSTLPEDVYFHNGAAVVYNNEIHIMGCSGGFGETNHYKWNGTSWSEASTLPYEFADGGAVVYNNEIHLLGGSGYESWNYNKHYKWNGTSWSEVSTLPINLNGVAVIYNNEIHIIGRDEEDSNSEDHYLCHYKWNGTSWSEVSTLPDFFYDGSVVVYDNAIHVFGLGDSLNTHYIWDGTSWSEATAISYDVSGGRPIIYDNNINLLGPGTRHYQIGKIDSSQSGSQGGSSGSQGGSGSGQSSEGSSENNQNQGGGIVMSNTKHITVDQMSTIMTSFATKADARFLKQADIVTYTVKKQATAETGYSATYQLFTVGTGTGGADEAVGEKINIPKDMVVESGTVVDITFDSSTNKLMDGAVDVTEIIKGTGVTPTSADAGKYIKLVIANTTNDKIYIKATDLVDVYTGGDGITITNGVVAIDIDTTNANGLSVDGTSKKIKMAVADTSTTGALSSTDWNTFNGKQDAISEGNGIDITSDVVSAKIDTSNANGLTVDTDGLKNNLAVPAISYVAATGTYVEGTTYYTDNSGAATVDTSEFVPGSTPVSAYFVAQSNTAANGAMTAAEKAKLNGIKAASNSDISAIINGIWAS